MACANDETNASTTTWDTGGESEPESNPLLLNPNYHRVHSGMNFEDETYDQLVVGNVARAVNDPGCCLDLVVAGPASPFAAVLFGGGSVERGLTVLAPRPRQLYKLASSNEGILDLALTDLDEDGYNDLLALTSAGQLGLRRGRAGDEDNGYFEALQSFDALANEELVAMELRDLDCDGDLDLAIAAPSAGGIVVLTQTKVGVFGDPEFVATPAAPNEQSPGAPLDVATGDFDGIDAPEIVSANDNGTLTFYERNGCSGDWTGISSARFHSKVGDCGEEEWYCINEVEHVDVLTTDNFCGTQLDDVTAPMAHQNGGRYAASSGGRLHTLSTLTMPRDSIGSEGLENCSSTSRTQPSITSRSHTPSANLNSMLTLAYRTAGGGESPGLVHTRVHLTSGWLARRLMMNPRIALSLLILVLAGACSPPKPGAEADESSPLIETQCDSFCQRAIDCSSEEFASNWGFTTQLECVDDCMARTQYAVEALDDPSCEATLGDKWQCAGMIEECQVWRSFEDASFGMLALDGNPCQDEDDAVVNDCNP